MKYQGPDSGPMAQKKEPSDIDAELAALEAELAALKAPKKDARKPAPEPAPSAALAPESAAPAKKRGFGFGRKKEASPAPAPHVTPPAADLAPDPRPAPVADAPAGGITVPDVDPGLWRQDGHAWVRTLPNEPKVLRRILDEEDRVVREESATRADVDDVPEVKAERGLGRLFGRAGRAEEGSGRRRRS